MRPYILDETEDFAVVFKPPQMHNAPLRQGEGNTLLDWYAAIFPPVMDLTGKKKGEGGLLHRLDFETQGLVLIAKNQQSLNRLTQQQDEGNFIKEYCAICQKPVFNNSTFHILHSSFPPPPFDFSSSSLPKKPFVIESFFRPYGQGRKQVRPVTGAGRKYRETATDKGGYYRTEITGIYETGDNQRCAVTARILRGFRHQIRCHLAWIGCPVLHDPLYGQKASDGLLALRATALFFSDPGSGEQREYRIDQLNESDEIL